MELAFNPWLAFAWGVLAGCLMALGTGGGGILAGVGHISVLGMGDPNAIKVANQLLELTSRVFSVPVYLRQRRVLWPLALSYGVGAPFGAAAGSWVSSAVLVDMASYRFVFALLVLGVAARMLYEAMLDPARRSRGLQRAFDVSRLARHGQSGLSPGVPRAPHRVRLGLTRIRIDLGGESFAFNPLVSAAGGFGISFAAAMLGVGGGFLATPFMASVLLFPMFFVAGTALVALMLPLAVSVATYLLLSAGVDWTLMAIEMPGIALGSLLGPVINRRIDERVLRLVVAVVLICIGVFYLI